MFQVFTFGSESWCYFGVFGGGSRFLCQKFRLLLQTSPVASSSGPISRRDSEKAMTQSFNFTSQSTSAINMKEE
ncbi:hypothetical protein PanWU01x14_311340 [Parasponia andersonii]|uniref:Uncharacterized protein n=1 Tax=Parasponia andersonii TaxID=3476 RepID=A0A2P5APZ0_PARAD|nr:hypothetical protein PanWU01x14_311340 [Parasponia andersonii]